MRSVLAVTGVRSEYFFSRSIFRSITEHVNLDLKLVVTGAHLSPLHGNTAGLIEADGFPIIERIESLLYSDRDASRIKGAAMQLQILAHVIDRIRPDWLLAVGDREEPMMTALCGAYMNIPIAHYAAGDRVVGNVDDMVRHSISRLSHMLLTTCDSSKQRLVRAGEQEWRVHNVGHAGIDRFRTTEELDRPEIAKLLGVSQINERFLVVIQHPVSSQVAESGNHMRATLGAAKKVGFQTFIVYPNSDAGSHEIIKVIEEFEREAGFHAFRTLPDRLFVNLLRKASALLGNSSMGLLEAAYLKLPVINVGIRQSEREHSENVFFVQPQIDLIVQQITDILVDEKLRKRVSNCSNPFGNGETGPFVARLLAETPIDKKLMVKDLVF
jgi:GDP/UDP-N,N'-diacetylbacillosamine 2-epimerase (hydrolysing)